MFKKMRSAAKKPLPVAGDKTPRRSPLFGALQGMLTLPADLDLTQPADPHWADLLDG